MGSIPGLAQWVKDLVLLWLWCRQAAKASIRSLAWEPPYATGAALKKTKKKNFFLNENTYLPLNFLFKNFQIGVPIMAQRKRI